MRTLGIGLAVGAALAVAAASAATAHSPGDVLVIRGNKVSKAGEAAIRPPRPERSEAAAAGAAEAARVSVTADGEVLDVRPLGAGETFWLVDPEDGRLVACQLRNTFRVEHRVLRCWSEDQLD